MPRNVRRYFISYLLIFVCFAAVSGQAPSTSGASTQATPAPSVTAPAPTSGEVMRNRISKAKALIAIKNYAASIFELENIRRETSDQTVHGVLNVLLMNCYLEQGDYKRAQEFLAGFYSGIKTNKPNAATNYYAVAGQVVKSARNQVDRYKSLGLLASDRNLPVEAVIDLDKMRETLEKVVEQSKALGAEKTQSASAFALLEEATNARSSIARDDYDSKRWKDEVADSREQLANTRSVVINAVQETPPTTVPSPSTIASSNPVTPPVSSQPAYVPSNASPNSSQKAPVFQPVSTEPTKPSVTQSAKVPEPVKETSTSEEKQAEKVAKTDETPVKTDAPATKPSRERRVGSGEALNAETAATTAEPAAGPLKVGSLLEFATQKASPVYPASARSLRMTGVVRVELVVDENGQVSDVQNLTGPSLLQSAAKDAVTKWKFKPFTRDGQPVKASGFLSFNFAL